MNKRYLLVPLLTLSIVACNQPNRKGKASNTSKATANATDESESRARRDGYVERAFSALGLDGITIKDTTQVAGLVVGGAVVGSGFGVLAWYMTRDPKVKAILDPFIKVLQNGKNQTASAFRQSLEALKNTPGYMAKLASVSIKTSAGTLTAGTLAVASGLAEAVRLAKRSMRLQGSDVAYISNREVWDALIEKTDVIEKVEKFGADGRPLVEQQTRKMLDDPRAYEALADKGIDLTTLTRKNIKGFNVVPLIQFMPTEILPNEKKLEILTAMAEGGLDINARGPDAVTALWEVATNPEFDANAARVYMKLGADPFIVDEVKNMSPAMEMSKRLAEENVRSVFVELSKLPGFKAALDQQNMVGESIRSILEGLAAKSDNTDVSSTAKEILERTSRGSSSKGKKQRPSPAEEAKGKVKR